MTEQPQQRKFTDEQEEYICGLYFKRNLSQRQLAKKFRCGRSLIERALRRQKLKPRTRPESQRGKLSPRWKGGRHVEHGYVLIYNPSHLYCDRHGDVREHRLVMEKLLDRFLNPKEIVHHINGVGGDNRIENLKLFNCQGKHAKKHGLGKTIGRGR